MHPSTDQLSICQTCGAARVEVADLSHDERGGKIIATNAWVACHECGTLSRFRVTTLPGQALADSEHV